MTTLLKKIARQFFTATTPPAVRSPRLTALETEGCSAWNNPVQHENLNDLCEVATRHVWVHKAITQISCTIAGIPFKVWRTTTDPQGNPRQVVLNDHPLVRLIDQPNPHYTGFELIELWIRHLLCTGMSFTVLESDNTELWPVHPGRVKIIPDKNNFIAGYQYEVGARSIRFAPDEMVYLRLPDPRPGREYYGLGPVAAARLGLALDLHATRANLAFFENGARPFMALEVPTNLSDQQFLRLSNQWNSAHQGSANAKKIAILEGGIKLHEVGLSSQDMEWVALRKLSREEVLAVLGVPPIIAGLTEGTSFSNSDQQRQFFVENLETCYLRRLSQKLTTMFQMVGLLQPDETCGWDTTELKTDALAIDRRTLAAQRAVLTALMSPNEARQIYFNLPPYPGGDRYFAPVGTTTQLPSQPDHPPPEQTP